MFRFENKQITCEIGSVKIGGQPGTNPTVLAGTLFYEKHGIVKNPEKGEFDVERASALIKEMERASEETHVPALLHLFFRTEEAGKKYVDFALSQTDLPLILDSTEPLTRAKLSQYCTEIGIADKVIYNSINSAFDEREKEALQDAEIYSAIVLAFNALNTKVEGVIELLETGGKVSKRGLFEICKDLNIKNLLLDPGAIPSGQKSQFLRSLIVLKAKYGYPVGCGIHNVPSAWKFLKGKEYRKICDIASNVLAIAYCSDFLLFGPIEYAKEIFPLTAMCDIITCEQSGAKPAKNHPINFLV